MTKKGHEMSDEPQEPEVMHGDVGMGAGAGEHFFAGRVLMAILDSIHASGRGPDEFDEKLIVVLSKRLIAEMVFVYNSGARDAERVLMRKFVDAQS